MTLKVILGQAEDFLRFDPGSGELVTIPGKYRPPGEYRILVTLQDDNANGKRSSEYWIVLKITDESLAETGIRTITDFKTSDDYLTPLITEITMFGEVTLSFNKDVQLPTNETWFEEQLRSLVHVEDINLNKNVTKPAFEVEFVQSFSHVELITMTWEYKGWAS